MPSISAVPAGPVRQIAYFVEDAVEAAKRHSDTFGSGPFFVLRNVALTSSKYGGAEHEFDHTSAYGQWGGMMVEMMQQHNSAPSACHDIYPHGSNRFGIHHTALMVDNLDNAIGHFEEAGYPLVQYSMTAAGLPFVFIDTTKLYGHMIELYEGNEMLTGFYAMVADAAADWEGSNPIRELG